MVMTPTRSRTATVTMQQFLKKIFLSLTDMHVDSILELYLPGSVYSDNESRLLAVTPDLSSPSAGKPPRASCAWVEA